MHSQNPTRNNSIISDNSTEEESKPLSSTFSPGPMDVICSRGKSSFKHPGNCKYRKIIKLNLAEYATAKTKSDKTIIVSDIMNSIREESSSGIGFVKLMKDGRWYEVGESVVREKIGQSFRDLLHNKYSSSSKAKQIRKKRTLAAKGTNMSPYNMINSESGPDSCSNLIANNEKGNEQATNKEWRSELKNNYNMDNELTDEICWAERKKGFSYCEDDDEPLPIDLVPFHAFPIVSPNSSFTVYEESSSDCKELLNAMGALISENETQQNDGDFDNEGDIASIVSPLSLSLSSEPIGQDIPIEIFVRNTC